MRCQEVKTDVGGWGQSAEGMDGKQGGGAPNRLGGLTRRENGAAYTTGDHDGSVGVARQARGARRLTQPSPALILLPPRFSLCYTISHY